jgi:endonuclease/exonuclease/phosphatase family metal-dependent hydrolase
LTDALRLVAYNFLTGGSPRRTGHWSRVLRALRPTILFAQECRPPDASHGERFRPSPDDTFLWRAAAPGRRWGTALLVRGHARPARFTPICVPQFDGWVVGGELHVPHVSSRPVRLFSVHGPAGERGYVRTMHEILDRLLRLRGDADLLLGGDFNVAVGRRPSADPRPFSRGERDLLDRLDEELALVPCWQTANPGRRLAQTLRWSGNPTTPYHCDGLFIPRSWTARLASCRVVRGPRWVQLSDHNPVFAEIAPSRAPR